MDDLIPGSEVTVVADAPVGHDPFGQFVCEPTYKVVADVLWHPVSTTDVTTTNRPDGRRVDYRLYWPRGDDTRLAGKRIIVDGHECEVVGDLRRMSDALAPCPRNMVVEVVRVDG